MIQLLQQKKYLLLLTLVIILAACVRFYQIDKVPVSLYWDETATTYNAYSIAYTMRDEYGTFMPLLFRSFNDYKMSGNIYLTAGVVRLFGLNEFSARATSAFFGSLTVVLIYFLLKELLTLSYKKSKIDIKHFPNSIRIISLLASLLLAISPWHIIFSRTGFEANVGLFFVVLGVWLLIRSITYKGSFYLSCIILAVSFYFYRSIHIFLPLLLLGGAGIYYKEFLSFGKKRLLFGFILFAVILAPLVPQVLSNEGLARVRQVNIVSNSQDKVYEYALKAQQEDNTVWAKIFYNRRYIYFREFVGNYLSHFSPDFLFIHGDANPRHHVVYTGLLYLWEIPFLLIGLLSLSLVSRKERFFILLWLFLAPLPAAFSVPSPHALRALHMVIPLQLFCALGIYQAYITIRGRYKILLIGCILVAIPFFFSRFIFLYFESNARITSSDWADGYKQLAEYVIPKESKYDKIIISGHYWEPYVYILFYKNYDPALYQKTGSSNGFDKYLFGGTSWDKDKNSQELGGLNLKEFAHSSNVLVALSPVEYEKQKATVHKLTEIRDHNNVVVFIVGDIR